MLDSNPPLAEDLEAKEWRNTLYVICLQICWTMNEEDPVFLPCKETEYLENIKWCMLTQNKCKVQYTRGMTPLQINSHMNKMNIIQMDC